MISGINASLSALTAVQKKVESTANNIANVNSDGYKKTKVTLTEAAPQGVTASVQRIDTPGNQVLEQTGNGQQMVEKSNVEMTEEIPSLILSRRAFQANLKVIESQNEMLGSLIDIKR